MKVAALQMNVALGEPKKNIDTMYRLAAKAMENRPDAAAA